MRRRPGGLVEVDGSFLEGDQERETREELRDRRPRQRDVVRPVGRDDSVGARDAGSGRLRVPAVDRAQRLHGADSGRNRHGRYQVPAVSDGDVAGRDMARCLAPGHV